MTKQSNYPLPLPQDEVRRLIAVAQKHNGPESDEARAKVCLHNMLLVCGLAGGYHAAPMDDLIQEGYLALNRCVERFDLSRTHNGRPIRFSTYAVWAIKNAFYRMGEQAETRTYHEWSCDHVSDNLHPRLDADEFDQPADFVAKHLDKLSPALDRYLDNRERQVLDMRVKNVKLQDIGQTLSISKERVRQLESRALQKLAVAFNHRGPTISLSKV